MVLVKPRKMLREICKFVCLSKYMKVSKIFYREMHSNEVQNAVVYDVIMHLLLVVETQSLISYQKEQLSTYGRC